MVCYREKVIKHFGQRNHEIKLCFPNLKLGAMCKIYANSQTPQALREASKPEPEL